MSERITEVTFLEYMWDTAGDNEGLCLTGIKWCVVPKLH